MSQLQSFAHVLIGRAAEARNIICDLLTQAKGLHSHIRLG